MKSQFITMWFLAVCCQIADGQTNVFPASGNVGIGTLSPTSALHLAPNGSTSTWMTIDKNSGTESGLQFQKSASVQFYFYTDNADNDALKIQSTALVGENDDYPRLFIPYDTKNLYFALSGGNVAIGHRSPISTLDVNGTGRFRRQGSETSGLTIGGDALSLHGWGAQNPYIEWVNSDDTRQGYLGWNTNRLSLILENGYDFTVENGNVGIGTPSPNERLTVNGTIYGKEVKVDLSVPGPDYVFEPDYALPSLESINDYIKENKHLPEIPSAKEMEEDGLKVGEMNMLLLKKIEELTLHVIRQQEEIEKLRNEMHNRSDGKY